ncbi:MAG: terminase family protein [Clostridia bacterium]|nr:terminase family protein [Clostridia bacterium]
MEDIVIIEKIKNIQAEQQRRQNNNKLQTYNVGDKVHLKQIEFHKTNKKNRWVFGGNRTGKTECGAVEVVYLARGVHPYKPNKPSTSGWVVSLSTQVQRDVAQQKILYYLNPDWIEEVVMLQGRKDSLNNGVIDYIVIKNVFGNLSRIGFKSCDQGREKFQGTSLDYVWFDEEPPYDIYLECKMRVIDKSGFLFGTMTPLKGLTWVYNEIYLNNSNDSEVWHEHIEWSDNPFLPQEEIKQITQNMSSDELEARCYGKFINSGGMVYSEFDEQTHIIEPFDVPKEWYDNISIDPGLKNPLSAHWYATDYDGNVYVIAEHYEAEKDVNYHASKLHAVSDNLGWPRNSNGMLNALIDSAASQRTLSSVKSVVELFYDLGVQVNPNVNKDLFSGIARVKSYFKSASGEAKLFIFKNCTNLIREIKSYWWAENDRPQKKDDHALDELRYFIMSKPQTYKMQVVKSPIQKDKERLIKKLKNNAKRL